MTDAYNVVAILSAKDKNFAKTMGQAEKSASSFQSLVAGGLGLVSLAGVAAAAGKGLQSIIDIGSGFESQMSRVQAISGATAEEFEELRNQAIQLGADTSFSATSVAQGMENLAAAGFTVNETMDAMPGLLNLAAASGEDLASSSDIAASALRGFGLEASEAGHVADVLAENANRTNSSVSETGEALKYIAPFARAAGISIEETAAAIGIMANAGIQGSQAGTTLRGALSRISKPTDTMIIAMEKLGVSFYDSEGKMLSLADQVSMLEDAMSGLTDEERNNYLVTLYGQESLSGMLALINEGSGSLSSLTAAYESCDGSAQKAADTMMNNFAGAMEQLSGSAETLGIAIYDKISGPLTMLANSATDAVNQITDAFNSGGVQEAIAALFTMVYTQLSSSIPQIAEYGYQMILQLSQGFATGFPEILSKVLSFIQGLGENIAAAAPVFIQRGFEILSNFVQGIVNALPVLISQVPVVISTFANIINDNFPTILAKGAELLGQLVLGILKAIPTLVANIPKIVTAIVDVIEAFNWMNLGKNIIKLFANGIKGMIGFAKNAGKSIYDAVHNAIKNLPDTLKNLAKSAMNNLSSTISGLVSKVKISALKVASGIETALNQLPGKMLSIGKNLIKGLWNGISDMTGWIIDKIGGFASSVVDSICGFFGINSPSRVMRDEVGRYLAEGIGVGFEKYMPTKSMQNSLQDALGAVGSTKIHDISIPNIPTPSFDLAYSTSGGTMDLNDDYDYGRARYIRIEVPVDLDGREIAKASAEYMEDEQNKIRIRDDRKRGIR